MCFFFALFKRATNGGQVKCKIDKYKQCAVKEHHEDTFRHMAAKNLKRSAYSTVDVAIIPAIQPVADDAGHQQQCYRHKAKQSIQQTRRVISAGPKCSSNQNHHKMIEQTTQGDEAEKRIAIEINIKNHRQTGQSCRCWPALPCASTPLCRMPQTAASTKTESINKAAAKCLGQARRKIGIPTPSKSGQSMPSAPKRRVKAVSGLLWFCA